MEKITYTSRIEENKVIVDINEGSHHSQLVMTIDSLIELLRVDGIQNYCRAVDALIYSNARLTNFVLNSDNDQIATYYLGVSDDVLRYCWKLSETLKDMNPDIGLHYKTNIQA